MKGLDLPEEQLNNLTGSASNKLPLEENIPCLLKIGKGD
jgi:hypothetical protein